MREGNLPAPHDFLGAVGSPLAASQPEGWADGVLARGEALVLVNGLDEVPQEQRGTTREWLEQLLAAYEDAHFVVTTRPSAIPDGWLASSRFTELSVRPMDAGDVALFIGRWHTAARRGAAITTEQADLCDLETALRVTVRAQHDLAQLSGTPLMCALICALHRDRRGHLPHSRMELYEAALSMLLIRRDYERGVVAPEGIELTKRQSIQLLQRLAYWLVVNGQSEMGHATALALVRDALPAMPAVAEQSTAGQVLAHLVGRSGLLRRPTADTVDFIHRTFQDFLGAKAAIEGHDIPMLVNHAHDDQWEDVVRMAVAHARPEESADLLRRLIERGEAEDEHRSRLYLLAAASLPYATEVDPEVRLAVEAQARTLVPPCCDEEADELAALGRVALELLPGPEDLDVAEAAAVIQTAAKIGGDQAYAFLQRFVQHLTPSPWTCHELVQGWKNFDFEADRYAQEILLPFKEELRLDVSTPGQRDALRYLTPLTHVSFRSACTQDEITEHLFSDRLSTLHIYEGQKLIDLKFLRRFSTLQKLTLCQCTQISISKTSTNSEFRTSVLLHLSDEFRFDALPAIAELIRLSLYTHLPWDSLEELPAPLELTSLRLAAWINTSLHGISKWEHLKNVVINPPPSPAEWREIAILPRLTQISLSGYDLAQAVPLPGVVTLQLSPTDADAQIHMIPDVFPNVRYIDINCRTSVPDIIDISPLHRIEGLDISLRYADAIVGAELFPEGRVRITPRRRTAKG